MAIREIKSDMQIIEIKHDLASTISEADVAKGVLNIIKAKHHHPDGSKVDLHIQHASQPPQFNDEQFRKYESGKPQSQPIEEPKSGIEALAAQASTGWERAATPKSSGGQTSGSVYQSGSASHVQGFSIQCNCGMEFTGTANERKDDIMVTGSKYAGTKDDSATSQYKGDDSDDWMASAYETGGFDTDDSAYQSGGSSYTRGGT